MKYMIVCVENIHTSGHLDDEYSEKYETMLRYYWWWCIINYMDLSQK